MFKHVKKFALALAAVAALAIALPQTASVASAGEGWTSRHPRFGGWQNNNRYWGYGYRYYKPRTYYPRYYKHRYYPRYYGYNPYYYRHRHSNGAAIAAGIAGVVIGSAIVNNRYSDGGSWVGSPAWVDYCRRKYRTFDIRTGTFMHVSGVRKVCR